MKLKIFSDYSYIIDDLIPPTLKYVPILSPFWGEIPEDPKHFKASRFQSLATGGKAFLEMTSLAECDLAIFPCHWHLICANATAYERGLQFIRDANAVGKPVAIFSQGDWQGDPNLDDKNTLIFYTSSFQSNRNINEFAMPEWTADVREFDRSISVREKRSKPMVSFCGYAPPLGLPMGIKKLKTAVRLGADLLGITAKLHQKTGHTNRVLALSTLAKHPLVATSFITRQNFAFSATALQQSPVDPERMARDMQLEFCQNIIDSDYVVCCSGYENYSIRLYETLSFGRIPIFVNTDCVLPYDFAIDWKKYCVWVEESELSSIAEKVLDFHSKLSDREFVELQYECRNLWEKWLSPEGFFKNIYRHLNGYAEAKSPQYVAIEQ